MEAPMMMMQPVMVNPRRLSAVASRLPRGPSKGKGFQNWCKTRMQPASQNQPAEQPAKPAQTKSRAIPIVAPPAAPEDQAEGAVGGEAAPAPAAPAAPAVAPANPNMVVNLESSDSDEGHFSDHDLDVHENERTR